MAEAAIVDSIRNLLARRRAWELKTHGAAAGRNGIPDILCCYRGAFIAIEVKQPGRQPTPLQRHELDRIVQAGGTAFVATSPAQVADQLDLIDAQIGRRAA